MLTIAVYSFSGAGDSRNTRGSANYLCNDLSQLGQLAEIIVALRFGGHVKE